MSQLSSERLRATREGQSDPIDLTAMRGLAHIISMPQATKNDALSRKTKTQEISYWIFCSLQRCFIIFLFFYQNARMFVVFNNCLFDFATLR